MIPMPSHTFAPEQRREAHILRYLVLANELTTALRLPNSEFADLDTR